MTDRRALLLLSGGLDSSSLLFWMKAEGILPVSLFVDYGQPTSSAEWAAARAVSSTAGVPEPLFLRTDRVFPEVTSLVPDHRTTEAKPEYFPSRNLFLIALASMYAHQLQVTRIMIGIIAGTSQMFPDTSQEFIHAANKVIVIEHPHITLEAPFATRRKRDILGEALRSGLPFQLTYSCNFNASSHCWGCASCRDRWDAISSLGLL
jgi:7-cyano-7-deazaguanine synthase